MPINYSKWNSIDVSDSDEEEQLSKAFPEKKIEDSVKLAPPKEAIGSPWNASNFHWEEQKLDDWGKVRFRELLTSVGFKSEVSWENSRYDCSLTFSCKELEGEAWSHIRKGKSVLGYNFEVKLDFLGKEFRVNIKSSGTSYLGSFVIGVTFAAAWTPCAGPILGSILLLAGTKTSAVEGAKLLSVYSLGIAVPFFVTALLINTFVAHFNRFKKFIGTVNIISGIFLIAVGILIMTNHLNVIAAKLAALFSK